MVYYKTFGIWTLRASWLPSRCRCSYAYISSFCDGALLTECALKIIVPMANIDLRKWATELEEIGLYGLIVASSSLVSCPWMSSVLFS